MSVAIRRLHTDRHNVDFAEHVDMTEYVQRRNRVVQTVIAKHYYSVIVHNSLLAARIFARLLICLYVHDSILTAFIAVCPLVISIWA